MDILFACVTFAIGIVLVVKGGDLFVDAASWIAKAAKIPSFIIGATIVSLATTLPEMIVSCIAAIEGKIDMAIGNAVGSVTANTGLIMAIAFLFMTVVIRRREYIKQFSILVCCATLLLFGSMTGELTLLASFLLIFLFLVFMGLNISNARKSKEYIEPILVTKQSTIKNLSWFFIGAASIVIGSQFLVNGGSEIAVFLNIPERIVAVTLVAIGTSLPELVTTITAIRKKESQLSIGNIIGANIIDLSLILPLCSIISKKPLPVSALSLSIDLPACLIIILIALIPLLVKRKSTPIQGACMLAAYALYLVITL